MKRYLQYTWLALLLAGIHSQASANHIIGGVMTYECLGGGQYRFTMYVYRDCNCTDCANFDPVAQIGVYNCGQGTPCNLLSQGSTPVGVTLGGVRSVPIPDYPCLIPPDVCVEEGFYQFTLTLPPSNQSYHVSYQRCCRNETISNILVPDESGTTYTVEITPLAQQLCNSSPAFNDFPPTVLCAGQPFTFDHSATDPNGDQLVYEFCSPLLGGGPLLENNVFRTCGGAQPTPACPPPYGTVAFAAPLYSPAVPMTGAPPISIDPNTGIISGTPNLIGQFVVGVCVSEFRNGVLLSRVLRDFQFNVASCDPTVVARIQSDETQGDRDFIINSCGNNTIAFVNQSFQQQFISNFQWRFDINGAEEVFGEWNPTVTFPGVGQYSGSLLLNPGTQCGDTARVFVNVFPEVNADFSFAYDTCVAGPVEFTDLSTTGSCCLTNWQWNFGDTEQSNQRNPSHTYLIPGNLPVTLTVRDTNRCTAQRTRTIPYFPVPNLIVIAPSSFIGCTPAEIFFDNLSFPIDDSYDILWKFGDGGTSPDISPTYTYETPGIFTVSVDIASPIGCQTDTTFSNLIEILESPVAGYIFSPQDPSSLQPVVTFTDQSSGALRWQWDFGDGFGSVSPSPVHNFRDTGMYVVRQIVTHPSGCMDTLIRIVDIRPEVRIHYPTAFTPNSDAVNDIFRGVGIMEGATNFRLGIWNRWGELVFETNDYNTGWNGRKQNTGQMSPAGVYVVIATFRGPRGEPFEYKGQVTLLK